MENHGAGTLIDEEEDTCDDTAAGWSLMKQATPRDTFSHSFLFHYDLHADRCILTVAYMLDIRPFNTSHSIPLCVQIQDTFSILEHPMIVV